MLLRRSPGTARFESLGETIKELLERSPRLETYKLAWGDSMENPGLGSKVRITLLRSSEDRPARRY